MIVGMTTGEQLMSNHHTIHWFRQDLRLADNPAFDTAAKGGKILPLYILDDVHPGKDGPGAASAAWLHHALASLSESLKGKLSLYQGDPLAILLALCKKSGANRVTWNRCYEPWAIERDKKIKQALRDEGVEVVSCNGSLLWEPWEITKSDETPYRVFSPFYRKGCLNAEPPREPLDPPTDYTILAPLKGALTLDELKLLPTTGWDRAMVGNWEISEEGARSRFESFLQEGISHYKEGRNLPAKPYVSRLSPYLHFGMISPNTLWYGAIEKGSNTNIDHFLSELGWREFSYNLLYYNPTLRTKNLQTKFDHFPWSRSKKALLAWQKGQTGIPMVDAGMRELWQTGYMHNRVRMIVGSFLVKNLLLDWRLGEAWFWDCLVDADHANNSASWQWIAGCGADAAPYFRIFNPVSQGAKFDPDGEYIRQFVPELKELPTKHLFAPWETPELLLRAAGVELGKNYPLPIVDLKSSRERALEAFQSLKGERNSD